MLHKIIMYAQMLVHSILCMFTPLPGVSQHALASSTHKRRGFLLRSGCSLNHFGDFLLQRAARLHSLSTGENGLPGSIDVCWRERQIITCALEGKTGGQMCAGGKVLANCGASPSSAHQKREIRQAFPAAHIF